MYTQFTEDKWTTPGNTHSGANASIRLLDRDGASLIGPNRTQLNLRARERVITYTSIQRLNKKNFDVEVPTRHHARCDIEPAGWLGIL